MIFEDILSLISKKTDDPDNYLRLADYYLDQNVDLSYLSLENAYFYEEDPDRKAQISGMMQELRREIYISVVPSSFVILSFHNLECTKECIESIRTTCNKGSYEIVVVDNGSEAEVVEWLENQTDIKLILNKENKGFPVGCNQGIEAATQGNDIFLLNNDAVMMPNALYCMRMALYGEENVGAVGPMGSNVGNGQQIDGLEKKEDCYSFSLHNNIPFADGYESCTWLVGFALLIRHDVRERVGFFDERFTPGCYEDNDYCYRILELGYKNILCHNCLIYHYGSKGFEHERKRKNESNLLLENYRKLNEKWGVDIVYRLNQRREIVRLIEKEHPNHDDIIKVIEWEKDIGTALFGITEVFGNAVVYGEGVDTELVDYIILEEMMDYKENPYDFLRICSSYLKNDGKIIAVFSNSMHFSRMIPLLKGDYYFDKDGISNYSPLHNFTKKNIVDMFQKCGYKIMNMYDFVIGEEGIKDGISVHDIQWFMDLTRKEETAPEDQFLAYKYLIIASRN